MAGSIFLLFAIFAMCFAFFKFVKPAKSPIAAAVITAVIIGIGIWALPLLFKAIGALFTILIAIAAISLIMFLWNKLETKI